MTQANEQLAEAIAELLPEFADYGLSRRPEQDREAVRIARIEHVLTETPAVMREALAYQCHVALCEKYGEVSLESYVDGEWSVRYMFNVTTSRLQTVPTIREAKGSTAKEAIFNAVLNHSKGVA